MQTFLVSTRFRAGLTPASPAKARLASSRVAAKTVRRRKNALDLGIWRLLWLLENMAAVSRDDRIVFRCYS
jgi:hypothetical protein